MFIISKELFGGECTLQIICIFRSCSPSMNNRAFYTLYNLLHSVIITAFASSQTVTLIITIVIVFLIIPIAVLTSLQLPVSSSPCPLPLAHSLVEYDQSSPGSTLPRVPVDWQQTTFTTWPLRVKKWWLRGRIAAPASDSGYCYSRSCGVSRSVGLFVGHFREPYENGWTDRDAVWDADLGGPKEPCIK